MHSVYSLKNLYFSFHKTTEDIHKLLCISDTVSSIVYELNWWLFDLYDWNVNHFWCKSKTKSGNLFPKVPLWFAPGVEAWQIETRTRNDAFDGWPLSNLSLRVELKFTLLHVAECCAENFFGEFLDILSLAKSISKSLKSFLAWVALELILGLCDCSGGIC